MNLNELFSNPFFLLIAGAVITWLAQSIRNFMANPAKNQIERISQSMQFQNEATTTALNNNTQAMQALTNIVNDHEARLQVLQDFKERHEAV